MPKGRSRYRIEELRKGHAAKIGGETIDFDQGEESFSVPAPGFFPDDVKRAVREDDDLAFAEALLGDQWDRFVAAGGRSDDVALLLDAYAQDQGADLGESSRSRS